MEESILHYIHPKGPFLWAEGEGHSPNSYYLFRAEIMVEKGDCPANLWISARKNTGCISTAD